MPRWNLVEQPRDADLCANDVYVTGTKGTLVHWNGTTYVTDPTPPLVTLASVWGTGGEYWVVGGAGTILHKVGAGAWTKVTSPTSQFLYAVAGSSTTNVWAVGSAGVILHYDGTAWTLAASPTTVTLRGITPVPGGGFAAVGDGGTVIVRP